MKKGSDAVRAAQTLKGSCVNAIYTTWKDHLEKFLDNNKKVEEDLINKGFVAIPESCKERVKETMGVIQEKNDFNE